MELLIGCGNDRVKKMCMPGTPETWTNLTTLDIDPNCGADVIFDLDQIKENLPFPDNTFDEVHAHQVLEHLGQQGDYQSFFHTFTDLWRVLKPGGLLCASVPTWHGLWAFGDPGHRRIINSGTLVFLSQAAYAEQVSKTAMTDYRWCYSADFETVVQFEKNESFWFCLKAIKG